MSRLKWLVIPGCLLVLAPILLAQRPPSEDEKEKMRVRMQITKEQQAQIEAVFTDEQKQERDIRTRERELWHQLYILYGQFDFDRNQALAIRKELGSLFRKRIMLHAETQEKLRKILTREQFDRMMAAMKEQREKWMKEHPRPGPGGGPSPTRGACTARWHRA